MSLQYEPSSEPLHISAVVLRLRTEPICTALNSRTLRAIRRGAQAMYKRGAAVTPQAAVVMHAGGEGLLLFFRCRANLEHTSQSRST